MADPVIPALPGKGVTMAKTEDGFKYVQDRRGTNKFLGSEHPRTKINPNGYDPIERAKATAKAAATAKLQQAVDNHG